jgi:hypothetical protein
MEVLEIATSFEEQERCSFDPNELTNQWEDWVHGSLEGYLAPVFSDDEQTALRAFQEVWSSVADASPNPLPPLAETMKLPEWERLRAAAADTIRVFAKRGRLSEDEEIADDLIRPECDR